MSVIAKLINMTDALYAEINCVPLYFVNFLRRSKIAQRCNTNNGAQASKDSSKLAS